MLVFVCLCLFLFIVYKCLVFVRTNKAFVFFSFFLSLKEDLEVNGASHVFDARALTDVSGVRPANDVQQDVRFDLRELRPDVRLSIARLIEIREEVGRNAANGLVAQDRDVIDLIDEILIGRILAEAFEQNVVLHRRLPQMANLDRQFVLRLVRLRHPAEDLIQFNCHARLALVVAVVLRLRTRIGPWLEIGDEKDARETLTKVTDEQMSWNGCTINHLLIKLISDAIHLAPFDYIIYYFSD